MRCKMIPLALMLVAGLALADEPTTQPENPSDSAPTADSPMPANDNTPALNRPRRGGGMGHRFDGPRGSRFGNDGEPPLAELRRGDAPTDEEWEQVSKFTQENFPNRWKMYERVHDSRGDDAQIVKALKLRMANRYRALMKAQSDTPDLYEMALQQGKLEDQASGIARQLQADPDNQGLKQQLHDTVTQLVKTALDERRRRLDLAKQSIDMEEDNYNRDVQNVDGIVEKRVNRLTNTGENFDRLVPPTTNPSTTAPSN